MQTDTMQDKRLPLTNEVIGVLAASECARDAELDKAFAADPKGALQSEAAMNLPADVEVRAVRNSADEINIAIPAHAVLGSDAVRNAISEDDMRQISGGEVIGLVIGAIVAGTAAAGAVAGAGVATAKVIEKKNKQAKKK